MQFETEIIQIDHKPVALINMNGDEENTLTRDSLIRFASELTSLKESGEVEGIIISSRKEKFFSSGLNLANIINTPAGKLVDEILAIIEFFYFMLEYPLPVISEINGHALGGGAIIALGSDYRYMLEKQGRIGFTEVHVGLPLPNPIIEKLKYTVRPSMLNDLALLGKTLKGHDAVDCGLVHGLEADRESLERTVRVKMKEMLQIDQKAFSWTKYTINSNIITSHDASMEFIESKLKNDSFIENLLSKFNTILDRKK